jgi:hypothetical protein
MPIVPALLEPCGRCGVGREARMEVGLPDRAMVGLLLPPSASGFFLHESRDTGARAGVLKP